MAKVLLIESRDPFEHAQTAHGTELAKGLLEQKDQVTLLLVQNGVLPARSCPASAPLSELARLGARVLADDLSLRERGIDAARLADGVRATSIDEVVDLLAAGAKVVWL